MEAHRELTILPDIDNARLLLSLVPSAGQQHECRLADSLEHTHERPKYDETSEIRRCCDERDAYPPEENIKRQPLGNRHALQNPVFLHPSAYHSCFAFIYAPETRQVGRRGRPLSSTIDTVLVSENLYGNGSE